MWPEIRPRQRNHDGAEEQDSEGQGIREAQGGDIDGRQGNEQGAEAEREQNCPWRSQEPGAGDHDRNGNREKNIHGLHDVSDRSARLGLVATNVMLAGQVKPAYTFSHANGMVPALRAGPVSSSSWNWMNSGS